MKQTKEVLYDVEQERIYQMTKWGNQSHDLAMWHVILSEEIGEVATEIQNIALGNEERLRNLYFELIQVAAVAVQTAEKVRERIENSTQES